MGTLSGTLSGGASLQPFEGSIRSGKCACAWSGESDGASDVWDPGTDRGSSAALGRLTSTGEKRSAGVKPASEPKLSVLKWRAGGVRRDRSQPARAHALH